MWVVRNTIVPTCTRKWSRPHVFLNTHRENAYDDGVRGGECPIELVCVPPFLCCIEICSRSLVVYFLFTLVGLEEKMFWCLLMPSYVIDSPSPKSMLQSLHPRLSGREEKRREEKRREEKRREETQHRVLIRVGFPVLPCNYSSESIIPPVASQWKLWCMKSLWFDIVCAHVCIVTCYIMGIWIDIECCCRYHKKNPTYFGFFNLRLARLAF